MKNKSIQPFLLLAKNQGQIKKIAKISTIYCLGSFKTLELYLISLLFGTNHDHFRLQELDIKIY